MGRKHLFASVSGSVAAGFAIAMPIIFLAVGAAIDMASVVSQRSKLKANLDAAVLAGASVFVDARKSKKNDMETVARGQVVASLEANDQVAGQLNITIDKEAKSIEGQYVTPAKNLIIGKFLTNAIEIAASAKAIVTSESQPVCILTLSKSPSGGIKFIGNSVVEALDCVIWSNAMGSRSITFDGMGVVKSARLCAAGRAASSGLYIVKPPAESECENVSDPLASWKPPVPGTCDFSDATFEQATVELNPGVYCGGLRVTAQNIFLNAGVYIIQDGPLSLYGMAQIRGRGVGIYLAGKKSNLDILGSTVLELTAQTSGPMAGVVLASDALAAETESSIAGRSVLDLGGIIYLPTHKLSYEGASVTRAASPVTTIISDTLTITGDASLQVMNDKSKAPYAPAVETDVGFVRLVE